VFADRASAFYNLLTIIIYGPSPYRRDSYYLSCNCGGFAYSFMNTKIIGQFVIVNK